jgi:predicted dehydrogenase
MTITTLAIIGAGGRGITFAQLAQQHADVRIVAVVEHHPQRLAQVGAELHLEAEALFTDWQALAASPMSIDAVVIATWDRAHADPTCAFLARGSHVLLEKPMATTHADCLRIVRAQNASGRRVSVCHTMRYGAGFRCIEDLITNGTIGRVVAVDLVERVAFWHQAHSYVRGNAANSQRSAPMLLTKSCHDLDWLCKLLGGAPHRVTSIGGQRWFTAANAPAGAPKRCTDGCPHEATCTYSALRCYVDTQRRSGWPAAMCSPSDHSREAHLDAVRNGPYGRCVWHCDNDVVDHQVVLMEFPQAVTATFTVTGLTKGGGRLLRVHGTLGEILYDQDQGSLVVKPFDDRESYEVPIPVAEPGLRDADRCIFTEFIAALRNGVAAQDACDAREALQSHAAAFAAEASRTSGKPVLVAPWLAIEDTSATGSCA